MIQLWREKVTQFLTYSNRTGVNYNIQHIFFNERVLSSVQWSNNAKIDQKAYKKLKRYSNPKTSPTTAIFWGKTTTSSSYCGRDNIARGRDSRGKKKYLEICKASTEVTKWGPSRKRGRMPREKLLPSNKARVWAPRSLSTFMSRMFWLKKERDINITKNINNSRKTKITNPRLRAFNMLLTSSLDCNTVPTFSRYSADYASLPFLPHSPRVFSSRFILSRPD